MSAPAPSHPQPVFTAREHQILLWALLTSGWQARVSYAEMQVLIAKLRAA